jgi:CheY-like chemotaxis protein
MPGVDGLTLVRQYRTNPITKDIAIIVLSTKDEPAIKSEAFAAGANDYLVKLPDKVELIARIRHRRGVDGRAQALGHPRRPGVTSGSDIRSLDRGAVFGPRVVKDGDEPPIR